MNKMENAIWPKRKELPHDASVCEEDAGVIKILSNKGDFENYVRGKFKKYQK